MITRDGLAQMLRALVSQGVSVGVYMNETPPASLDEVESTLPAQSIPADEWLLDEQSSQMESRGRRTFNSTGRMGLMRGYYLESGGRLMMAQPFLHPVPFMTTEDKLHIRPRFRAADWA